MNHADDPSPFEQQEADLRQQLQTLPGADGWDVTRGPYEPPVIARTVHNVLYYLNHIPNEPRPWRLISLFDLDAPYGPYAGLPEALQAANTYLNALQP